MLQLNFIWKVQTGTYQNGEDLFLNRIHLGSVSWNSSVSRDDPDKEKKRYIGQTYLIPTKYWVGENIQEVKTKIEKNIIAWFNEALKSSEAN